MLVDRCVDTLTRVSKNSKFVILMRNNFIYAFNFKRDSFRRQRNIFELLFQYDTSVLSFRRIFSSLPWKCPPEFILWIRGVQRATIWVMMRARVTGVDMASHGSEYPYNPVHRLTNQLPPNTSPMRVPRSNTPTNMAERTRFQILIPSWDLTATRILRKTVFVSSTFKFRREQ